MVDSVSWLKNGKGFSWIVTLTPKGCVRATLRLVNTRRGEKVERALSLVPKRASQDESRELFTEFYDLNQYRELMSCQLMLLSRSGRGEPLEPIEAGLLELAQAMERLSRLQEILKEVRKIG